MSNEEPRLIEHRTQTENQAAIVFIHGFGGDAAATWGNFPNLLKESEAVDRWDIYSLGYPTRLRLDLLAGIWSANPDLPMLALSLRTSCIAPPLDRYKSLALIAHSMGGLVVQRTLLDYNVPLERVTHLFLFGTPSGGLKKASPFQLLKRQIRDMSPEKPFIKDLRARWKARFGTPNQSALPCDFWSIAGEEDEFVPAESSLGPFQSEVFPETNLAAVPGNHVQIVKPADASNKGVQLVLKALQGKAAPAGPWNSAAVALESRDFNRVVNELNPHQNELDDDALVQLALALDGLGRGAEAIAVLESRRLSEPASQKLDAMGVLAGRLKRRWLAERRKADAERARQLYADGFAIADSTQKHDAAFYLGINVAFMDLAYGQDRAAAKAMASKVLNHCQQAPESMWGLATQGEAYLVLGDRPLAAKNYRQALASKPAPRQIESMYHQAMKIADLVSDPGAAAELETIFRPKATKAL